MTDKRKKSGSVSNMVRSNYTLDYDTRLQLEKLERHLHLNKSQVVRKAVNDLYNNTCEPTSLCYSISGQSVASANVHTNSLAVDDYYRELESRIAKVETVVQTVTSKYPDWLDPKKKGE